MHMCDLVNSDRSEGYIENRWIGDGWLAGWLDGWMDGWMDGYIVFGIETASHYVSRLASYLLSRPNWLQIHELPAPAFLSAGITGIHHHIQS